MSANAPPELAAAAERWQRIKAILADALECADAGARAKFVAAACGDDAALRAEVEAFLAREAATGLEQYADAMRGSRAEDAELHANTGRRVGAYELIRELGRGGMGAVWLAARADGRFEQQVAIKLLKRGTDTEEVLRRFRAERQILARLEHPNIARLLDGGETDDGLPYFVLEYVLGAPVTDFVRAADLPLAGQLELFIKICAAVQHAHQNLIIHRDLKPANILVTRAGEPKLLDFGIAKLLDEDDGSGSGGDLHPHTLASHSRLTPAYASPEQARGEPVTTASDVYALGALLYELLAGRSPHRFSRSRPSPTELVRVIGDQASVRPSLVAANAAARPRLRGDLDNIVLKALEKNPARRYPTANALAEDLRRHLEGRPIRARPITWRYAAGKFIVRHRLAVGAAALLVVSLLTGLGATIRLARVADREKQRAESRFNDTRRLAHAMLFEVNDAIERGPTAARQLLVRRALENLDKLSADVRDDAGLQRDLAIAYQKVGDVQSRLDAANVGDTAGAIVSYRKALALREQLLAQGGHEPAAARALAGAQGRLGDMLSKTGNTVGALTAYRRAVHVLETDAAPATDREARRELGRMCDRLGCTLGRTGDLAGALRYIFTGRAIRGGLADAAPEDVEAQVDVVRSDSSLAYFFGVLGRPEEALALERRNAALLSRLAAAHPADLSLRRSEMDGHEWVGLGLTATGDAAGALAEFRLALALAEESLARDPANVQLRNDLGDVLHETGDALRLADDPRAAADFYRRALGHYRAVADADPVNIHARRQVAHVEHRLALALGASGDAAGAVTALRALLPRLRNVGCRRSGESGIHARPRPLPGGPRHLARRRRRSGRWACGDRARGDALRPARPPRPGRQPHRDRARGVANPAGALHRAATPG